MQGLRERVDTDRVRKHLLGDDSPATQPACFAEQIQRHVHLESGGQVRCPPFT
jgi:hypothetical protein